MDMADPLQNDVRPHFASTLALLGPPRKPCYGHPKTLITSIIKLGMLGN